jgi:L,D-peptidoglycan transpeptidase YkuD (ErfK/YbiS/YcfS/YnhG family)
MIHSPANPVTIDVSTPGTVRVGSHTFQCALGPRGIVTAKTEGDQATPAGEFPLRQVMYRPDRIAKPTTGLTVRSIHKSDGWCDDPNHADYNRLISLPHDGSHEELWRDDHVYDIVVEIGHNDDPPVPGHGSAIFMHVAHDDYAPTAGCVALHMADLLVVLELSGPGSVLRINPDQS